jgi:hypothetical protein
LATGCGFTSTPGDNLLKDFVQENAASFDAGSALHQADPNSIPTVGTLTHPYGA